MFNKARFDQLRTTARNGQKLSIERLARKIDLSSTYLHMISRGLVPTPAVRERIASGLGVPAAELWPDSPSSTERAA
jgi:transcriptional regulator with XRE-family HTH domain